MNLDSDHALATHKFEVQDEFICEPINSKLGRALSCKVATKEK